MKYNLYYLPRCGQVGFFGIFGPGNPGNLDFLSFFQFVLIVFHIGGSALVLWRGLGGSGRVLSTGPPMQATGPPIRMQGWESVCDGEKATNKPIMPLIGRKGHELAERNIN